jgi:BlaI family transcriptional regulator, penicillinase repressor
LPRATTHVILAWITHVSERCIMPRVPRISEAEAEVMKVLWARSPVTAGEIIDALAGKTAWKPKTIKTLLARLVCKRAVGHSKSGKAYAYHPLIDAETFGRAQRKSLLGRVYGGALAPMLAAFIAEEPLSPDDIAELRALLDRKERGRP